MHRLGFLSFLLFFLLFSPTVQAKRYKVKRLTTAKVSKKVKKRVRRVRRKRRKSRALAKRKKKQLQAKKRRAAQASSTSTLNATSLYILPANNPFAGLNSLVGLFPSTSPGAIGISKDGVLVVGADEEDLPTAVKDVLIPAFPGTGGSTIFPGQGGSSSTFPEPGNSGTCEERYRLFMYLDLTGFPPRCSEYSNQNLALERCLEESKNEFLTLFPQCSDWFTYMADRPEYQEQIRTEVQVPERRVAITLVDYDGDCDRALEEYQGGLRERLVECSDPRYQDPAWCIGAQQSAWERRFPECANQIDEIIDSERPNIVARLLERIIEDQEGYPHCSEQYEWTRDVISQCMQLDTHAARVSCIDVHRGENAGGETQCDELQYQWLDMAETLSYSMQFTY